MKKKPSISKKFSKNDRVVAIAGNDRGKTGTILSVKGDRIIVQGLNIRKKHVKPSEQNPKGGILELEKPIHISNLKPCTEDGTPIKLKVRTNKSGEKEFFYLLNGEEIFFRNIKKRNT